MSRYQVGERLWGALHRGHRARSHPSRTLLITVGEPRALETLAPRFELAVPRVARMLHLGPLGDGRAGVVEEEPCGRPLVGVALPLRPETVAALVRQIAAVLAGLHRTGTALGGLQPELIYVRPDASGPVVTGLAARAAILLRAASPFPNVYAAPGEESAPAADVFALCALASHWLTGHHPFRGMRRSAQLAAMARGEQRPWSGPDAWGELLARGLSSTRERATLDDLVAGLDEVGAGTRLTSYQARDRFHRELTAPR
jgi:hypothetical protein